MVDAVTVAHSIAQDRFNRYPDSHFYAFASKEMVRINERIKRGPPPDKAFYESLTHGIGLMCARELETSDMEFCDAVYGMIEEVRHRVE